MWMMRSIPAGEEAMTAIVIPSRKASIPAPPPPVGSASERESPLWIRMAPPQTQGLEKYALAAVIRHLQAIGSAIVATVFSSRVMHACGRIRNISEQRILA